MARKCKHLAAVTVRYPTGASTELLLNRPIQFLANVIRTFTFAICYRLSVCRLTVCLSVTLLYPTQPVEKFGIFSAPYDSPGTLYSFLMPIIVGGGRPFPPEIWAESDPPPFEHNDFDQYLLIVPQP